MTDRELMQQALDALEEINKLSIGENAICLPAEIDGALDALRERLAQQEQEPVAMYEDWYNPKSCGHCGMVGGHIKTCRHYTTPAQQEPVAWLELLREARDNCKASIVEEGISASRKEYRIDLEARLTAALNTSPPQRKPLTDEEIDKIYETKVWDARRSFARAIEAAHGIKGEA